MKWIPETSNRSMLRALMCVCVSPYVTEHLFKLDFGITSTVYISWANELILDWRSVWTIKTLTMTNWITSELTKGRCRGPCSWNHSWKFSWRLHIIMLENYCTSIKFVIHLVFSTNWQENSVETNSMAWHFILQMFKFQLRFTFLLKADAVQF